MRLSTAHWEYRREGIEGGEKVPSAVFSIKYDMSD